MSSEVIKTEGKVCEDRISALPNDLLLRILSHIPTKDAVKTMILSKRWRFVWTMMHKLDFKSQKKRVWEFVHKSLQLHRAPLLESLSIKLRQRGPIDKDVGMWVTNAVERCVRELKLDLASLSSYQILPASLYTCEKLVNLTLSRKVFVDVPSKVRLPSLKSLELSSVVYKDQDSHVRLLSSCPVLKDLLVIRKRDDNVTVFNVKVPSLESLRYMNKSFYKTSLVVDSPGLYHFKIYHIKIYHAYASYGHFISFGNMPRLDVAVAMFTPDDHMTSFSSVMFLSLKILKLKYWSPINFSRLRELNLCGDYFSEEDWYEPLMLLLHNAPLLKVLMIHPRYNPLPLKWNLPHSIPECLSSHLEIFQWKEYYGFKQDRQFVSYILANSMHLKTARFSLSNCYSKNRNKSLNKKQRVEKRMQKIKEKLESMPRVSVSSQLFFSADLKWRH